MDPLNPQPVSTPQPVIEQSSRNWLKIALYCLAGILIAAGLVFAGYTLGTQSYKTSESITQEAITQSPKTTTQSSPTTNPTTEWKTYNNEILSYTIQHPSDWKVSTEHYIGAPGEITIIPPESQNVQAYPTVIAITSPTTGTRYNLDTQTEFDEWYAKDISDGTGQRQFKIANRLIDGNKAVEFITRALPGDATEAYYGTTVWFRKNNRNYYIEFGPSEEIVNKRLNTWNSFLQTFQFTK